MSDNPLNIQEPKLLAYYHEVNRLFALNNLPFESEYHLEPDPKFNSSVSYFTEINGVVRGGFILHKKGKGKSRGRFGGVILKGEVVRHLEMEGFTQEQIGSDCPIFASAPTPEVFFCMVCLPILNDLVLEG